MRTARLLLAALAVAGVATAAEPDKPHIKKMIQTWRETIGYRYKPTPFDLARQLGDLTPEQQAALVKLQGQRGDEFRKEIEKVNRELDKRFAALVLEVLGPKHKDVFEKVMAALAGRDATVEAARDEGLAALAKLRDAQGLEPKTIPFLQTTYVPRRKQDIVRNFLKLTEDQERELNDITRNSWAAMRDALRDIPKPDDWRDADARRQYTEAMRKAQEAVEDKIANAVLPLLTPEQKKLYEAALKAVETHDTKVKEAEDACDQKLIALLGEEKFRALFEPPGLKVHGAEDMRLKPEQPPKPEKRDKPDKPAEGDKQTDF
jgi:Spy/CpxP family protein refolding chaperone